MEQLRGADTVAPLMEGGAAESMLFPALVRPCLDGTTQRSIEDKSRPFLVRRNNR
jgi:hypothetical protein